MPSNEDVEAKQLEAKLSVGTLLSGKAWGRAACALRRYRDAAATARVLGDADLMRHILRSVQEPKALLAAEQVCQLWHETPGFAVAAAAFGYGLDAHGELVTGTPEAGAHLGLNLFTGV